MKKPEKEVTSKKVGKTEIIWRPSHHVSTFSGYYPYSDVCVRTKVLCPSKLGIFMTVFSSWPDWSMVLAQLAHISLSPHSFSLNVCVLQKVINREMKSWRLMSLRAKLGSQRQTNFWISKQSYQIGLVNDFNENRHF